MKSLLRGPIASGTLRTSIVLGGRLLIQAGTLLLVARALGPDAFGAFAGIAALAVLLGAFGTHGTHLILLQEMSRNAARRDAVLVYAIPSTLVSGSILLALYLGICELAFVGLEVPIWILLAIGFAETVLQPLIALMTAEHLALGRVARSQILQILPLSLRLGAIVLVLITAARNPLAAYAAGYALASLVALLVVARDRPAPWPRVREWHMPNRVQLGEATSFAALNLSAAGPAELDKALATGLLPPAMAGGYAAGARIVGAATLPVMALMLAALPRLFREGTSGDGGRRLQRWLFATAGLYGVMIGAALWLAVPLIIWLLGKDYDPIRSMMPWLCAAVPGMTLRSAAGNVLMTHGRPWARFAFEILGLALLAALAPILIRQWGATSMPIALFCAEWGMACLGLALVFRFASGNSIPSATVSPGANHGR
ncbi:MAG TPA: hypothetical protein PKA16_00445 [Ottowia sp.]|uniref:lipopolysaccharide biosynthesis protein n=1 Tax=Ottowia sp. TaxID=1898956 RepID=UPI002B85BF5C|nr:oligosaccharide flippase family protein [Ottowia sp.]HMN19841.1 hypothetical protein [Ottowia sp.]